jgi:hypothetical protein
MGIAPVAWAILDTTVFEQETIEMTTTRFRRPILPSGLS